MNEPNWFDQIIVNAALVGAWITGEAGRAALAGAAGGLVRWLMSERRRIRDGIVSIIVGTLMARYATPITMAVLESWFGEMKGDVQNTAGFATGIIGMSLAKLIMGMFEAHVRRINGGGQPDA
ncbi:hypothetical protein LOS78_01915 [Paracoccus sp. MA]|uniref:hypothetical protein n=1 Tax=Paracoccus sp. MA TaxID=2895796 RepID=UPI001E2A746D|nr:hypothetical protein [Paracoccus sp. MA]UFM64256.1 hypothetical protein LOS78_01915 [Paracoccus sp. MA]